MKGVNKCKWAALEKATRPIAYTLPSIQLIKKIKTKVSLLQLHFMQSKKYQYNGQTHIFNNRRELYNKPTHTQNTLNTARKWARLSRSPMAQKAPTQAVPYQMKPMCMI